MRHVQGNSPASMFKSIDGILDKLTKKLTAIQNAARRKPIPFMLCGYKGSCLSREVVCGCLSLFKIKLKRVVFLVEEYPKETPLYAVVCITSKCGEESAKKIPLNQGENSFLEEREVSPGDRIAISIHYPEVSPKSVWITLRGEQEI